MPKIIASDSIILNYPLEKIWQVISDFDSYKFWWPKLVNLKILNSNPKIIGSKLSASPFNGSSFTIEAVAFVHYKEITLHYHEGIYSGYGKWRVEEFNCKTKLTYEVDLDIVDNFTNLISYILPVPKIHSLIFRKIFKNLEKYLKSSDWQLNKFYLE
jgi:ribosome-associated toxin RatA of RatAB toxin-antitoxin module